MLLRMSIHKILRKNVLMEKTFYFSQHLGHLNAKIIYPKRMIQIFMEASKMCYKVIKQKQKVVRTSCAGTIYDLVNL